MKRRSKFLSDNKALAAIEFAFVLPIILTMVFGAIEYSRAFYYQMKANKISGELANAITLSVPYYNADGSDKGANSCVDGNNVNENSLVLTENRLKEIISNGNIAAMLSPLNTDRLLIHVNSFYVGYGRSPTSSCTGVGLDGQPIYYFSSTGGFCALTPAITWSGVYLGKRYYSQYSNQANSGQGSFYVTTSPLSWSRVIDYSVGGYGTNYIGFPGENFIAVEVAIKFDSIIGGALSYFVHGYNAASGEIRDVSIYSPRNYYRNGIGDIEGGLRKLKLGGC
jgi:uncharacterized protein (UPF0333 family)